MLSACSMDDGMNESSSPLSAFTPKDDAEAELIALYLSQELYSSDVLYEQVYNELGAIRGSFGIEYPEINEIRFRPHWSPSNIIVELSYSNKLKVENGQFSAWDEYNEYYGLVSIDMEFLDNLNSVVLNFIGQLHPNILCEAYSKIEGIKRCHPWGDGASGFVSNLWPRLEDGRITYLFEITRNGNTDYEYLYFTYENDQAVLIGHWDKQMPCLDEHNETCFQEDCIEYCPGAAEPDWWSEAKLNLQQSRYM
jgi:hypothetical protein